MPKPPTLPTVDWSQVHQSAVSYEQWLADAESKANAEQIEQRRTSVALKPEITERLKGLSRRVSVLAIAEDWCGDVILHVPILQSLADATALLDVAYTTREQHPEIFIRFLTNGGEAIPKFVFLSESFVECGNWGPMPKQCKELIARGKASGDVASARGKVSEIYAQPEHAQRVIEELLHLIDIASS